MACGAVNSAERHGVQPSIIGSLVRLVELRPRAQSSTDAVKSARGCGQSEHEGPDASLRADRGDNNGYLLQFVPCLLDKIR